MTCELRGAAQKTWSPNLHDSKPMLFARAAVALALLSWSATAVADPEPAGDPAPADQPTIAPPAPDAPPNKVEEAKEVAKTAELTPIIPNPSDATRPAFQLYAEIDVPIL